MTIILTDSRDQIVAGSGQTVFNLNFVFENESDVIIYEGSRLMNNSEYTVQGAGLDPTINTRTITLNTPATEGVIYTPMRDAPFNRLTNFTGAPDFSAENINNEYDRIILMVQQLNTNMTQLMLKYNNWVDDSSGQSINILPKLPANGSGNINIWTANSEGDIIAGTIPEESSCSTLRSELLNDASGTDGSGLIGHYNTTTATSTTVRASLNTLEAAIGTTVFSTGMEMRFWGSTLPTGWLWSNGGTIGNASSGASNYANAAAQDLYVQIWTLTASDPDWFPIYDSVGALTTRGASAVADWNANKALSLPQTPGKTHANYTQMVVSSTFTAQADPTNTLTITDQANLTTAFPMGCIVQVSSTGTLPSGLLPATDYYVIELTSTTLQLASSTANVVPVAKVPITLVDTGSVGAVHTITRTLGAKVIGEWNGENNHLQTVDQMPEHTHNYDQPNSTEQKPNNTGQAVYYSVDTVATSSTGGSNFSNNVQPTIYGPVIIKL